MLPYHLYLYFCLSWLVPMSPYLQLPLGIKFSSCNIKTENRHLPTEKHGLPFAKEIQLWMFENSKQTNTQYIPIPEYGTCIRRNGLNLRLQTWSQAPKPERERRHKCMGTQGTLRPKQSWSSLHTLLLSPWLWTTNSFPACPDFHHP